MKRTITLLSCCMLLLCLFSCQTTSPHADPVPDTTAAPIEHQTEETAAEITAEENDEIMAEVSEETTAEENVSEEETTDDADIQIDVTLPGTELTFDPSYEPSISVLVGGDASHDIDLSVYTDSAFKPNEETVTFRIGDMVITGTYGYRTVSPFYRDSALIYTMQTGEGKQVRIDVSQDTGKLVRYVADNYRETEADGPILTEDACRAIAEKFISEVLAVTGVYELTEVDHEGDDYLFTYYRYIDQVKTRERISVRIGERGRLLSFTSDMLGSMDGVDLPDYDEAEILAAVEHKLACIYESEIENSGCSYEIENVYVTRLQDGKLYLMYRIGVRMAHEDGFVIPRTKSLLVCID